MQGIEDSGFGSSLRGATLVVPQQSTEPGPATNRGEGDSLGPRSCLAFSLRLRGCREQLVVPPLVRAFGVVVGRKFRQQVIQVPLCEWLAERPAEAALARALTANVQILGGVQFLTQRLTAARARERRAGLRSVTIRVRAGREPALAPCSPAARRWP
jgi:hypothetical protein